MKLTTMEEGFMIAHGTRKEQSGTKACIRTTLLHSFYFCSVLTKMLSTLTTLAFTKADRSSHHCHTHHQVASQPFAASVLCVDWESWWSLGMCWASIFLVNWRCTTEALLLPLFGILYLSHVSHVVDKSVSHLSILAFPVRKLVQVSKLVLRFRRTCVLPSWGRIEIS